MTIFCLTTIQLNERFKEEHASPIVRRRTVGYFKKFEKAENIVLQNIGDLYEAGHYSYCVIEEFPGGLYPQAKCEIWYIWSDNQYVRTIKPGILEHFINFGLG